MFPGIFQVCKPHGPGADLPARGHLAAARAGVRRLVAGRARGGTGAHPPQVYHSACGVSLEALLPAPPPPPGFQPFPHAESQVPQAQAVPC